MVSIKEFLFTDINECDINSGGCDHVCTNTNGSHICSCRPGYFLDSDGKTCRGMLPSFFAFRRVFGLNLLFSVHVM